MISYIGNGMISVGGENYSILDADIIDAHEESKPEWWDDAVAQAQQVRSSGGKALLVRTPDGNFLIAGSFRESFFSWLISTGAQVEYRRNINCVVISNMEWPQDTNTKMSSSDVQATSIASMHVSPETEHTVRLREIARTAQEEGYTLPEKSMFPTKRDFMRHQAPVVEVLAYRGRGILGDDVGSGKSSMFIGGFFSLVQRSVNERGVEFDDCWPLVIVTKSALIDATERECKAWFDGCKTYKFSGKKSKGDPKEAHVVLCALSSLKNNIDEIIDLHPKGVIFDESHMLKSMTAQRTKAALMLSQWIRDNNNQYYILCASATPMPNRPNELWAQLVISGMDKDIIAFAKRKQKFPRKIKPNFKASYYTDVTDQMIFDMRYCGGKPGFFGWDNKGATNQKELSELLYKSGFIRRKKSEFITPLPMLYQHTVICEFNDEQKDEYELAEKAFRDYVIKQTREKAEIDNLPPEEVFHLIREKMHKVDNAEAIMKMTALHTLVGQLKVDSAVRWLHKFFAQSPEIVGADTSRKKIIVFAHHRAVQKMLIEHEELKQYGVMSIVAGTKNINDIVDDFQNMDSGKNVLICYSEAREGLTLTAAKDVLVVELPFIPSHLIQMAGRCWSRFSELYPPHEAHIHLLTSDTGVDRYLEDMLYEKGLLNKSIIDGEFATNMLNSAESGDAENVDKIDNSLFAHSRG